MNITQGKIIRPQKVVIYGPEGIGKTTLASRFPDPVFIDTEGSTYHMDVRRVDKPKSWAELNNVVKEFYLEDPVCKTLVIDTADWAEQLCVSSLCEKYKKKGIEDFGYGKGYTYLQEEFGKLLVSLESVIAHGINVVLTAHAKMRKFEQPDEVGAYDRWELKLTKQVAPMVKEWADLVLFANYKTYVVTTEDQKHKAQGGKRVLYTAHHPCWDAKNRHGLPDEIPMEYEAIRAAIEPGAASAPVQEPAAPEPPAQPKTAEPQEDQAAVDGGYIGVPKELAGMMRSAEVLDIEVREVIAKKGYYPKDTPWETMERDGFVSGWVIPFWNNIVDMIVNDPNRLPF